MRSITFFLRDALREGSTQNVLYEDYYWPTAQKLVVIMLLCRLYDAEDFKSLLQHACMHLTHHFARCRSIVKLDIGKFLPKHQVHAVPMGGFDNR